jgi:fucose permease
VIPFAFGVFFAFGIGLVLVGSNQAELARDLGLDLAGSGLLGAVVALGIGVGVSASGPLVDRLPRRPILVAAALVAAAALLGVEPSMSVPRALAHLWLLGVGIGVHETLVNVSITERHAARAARTLLFVHSAVTLGAVAGPPAIGWLGATWDWTASFRAAGLLQLGLAAAALAVRFPEPPQAHPSRRVPLRAVWRPGLAPLLLIGFSYVGVETTLTLFAVPYATGPLGLSEARGLAAISSLWLGLLAGRLLLLALVREVGAGWLVAAGLLGGAVIAAGIGGGSARIELWFGAVGTVMGLVFPVMIALTAALVPEARGTATGLVAGAGAFGGFAVPWLHGAIGDAAGVAPALWSLAPWCAVMALAAGSVGRRLAR